MQRQLFEADHEAFRSSVRSFLSREVEPHYESWEDAHLVDRAAWLAAGRQGLLGLLIPEELGGMGEPDFRFRAAFIEEVARTATTSFGAGVGVHDDIVIPYLTGLATPEQKRRWLPSMADGSAIGAIAMTEPGTGSDLQGIRTKARRDGDEWVLDGQKTFITNGIHADIVVVVARTDPDAGARGLTLFVVERGMPGFERGRHLSKVGLSAQDTAELSFANVRVPGSHLLGGEGEAFIHLMDNLPLERLSIAVNALASATAAYRWTCDYVFERSAFGQRIGDFQNTRFVLAEISTEIDVTEAYVDRAILAHNAGELSAVEAAKAKWWATELQQRVTTRCLQLFGGYGYMLEYPIGRAFRDARIQTIYGGTTEIMKEIIGRDIAAGRS